ncbi:MAG: phosphate signaling complex protein PhoU [Planctomycetota bacterium]|jgi:phosphate transport system protein
MTHSLDEELAQLGQGILHMGGLVEQAVGAASAALTQRRADLARGVVEADDAIDHAELEVDEECLRLLALYHPVASDLRFITAVMKINNDLERIGDLGANLAARAKHLSSREPLDAPLQFEHMTETVCGMLHDSLEALVRRDAALARDVIRRDVEVNRMHREQFVLLRELMQTDPGSVERAMDLVSASRQLERIGDQTKNIAEDVVFLVEAKVLRHHRPDDDPA